MFRPGRKSLPPDFHATVSNCGVIPRSGTLGSFLEAFGTDSSEVEPVQPSRPQSDLSVL